jgi:argonaute-like protein implicated in RNA metabolism and viral defense
MNLIKTDNKGFTTNILEQQYMKSAADKYVKLAGLKS